MRMYGAHALSSSSSDGDGDNRDETSIINDQDGELNCTGAGKDFGFGF